MGAVVCLLLIMKVLSIVLFALVASMYLVEQVESQCVCTQEYAPVCGKDGNTYSNKGCAACSNVQVQCRGECPCSRCICPPPPFGRKVCGNDGNTYANACRAKCRNTTVKCRGACPCCNENISFVEELVPVQMKPFHLSLFI